MSPHLQRMASGHLAYSPASGHLAMGCPGEPDAPCECPEGLATCCRIADYTDGDLTACVDCDDASVYGSPAAWDGVFGVGFACEWYGGGSLAISGKFSAYDHNISLIDKGGGVCAWQLSIYCTASGEPSLIWRGEKLTGADQYGIYTRLAGLAGGCDTTSTLVVEACP